jgi:hypothetical protein
MMIRVRKIPHIRDRHVLVSWRFSQNISRGSTSILTVGNWIYHCFLYSLRNKTNTMAYFLPQNEDGIEVFTGNVAIASSDNHGNDKVVVPNANQQTDIISAGHSGYVHRGSIHVAGD